MNYYWLGYLLFLGGGSGGLIVGLVYLRRRQTPRPIVENLLLMTLTLFLTVMALEFYFKVFFAQSDALPTLANQNWKERYLYPYYNSRGYRDAEWTDALVAGKTKVMVIGDSFVEGSGIENPADRFPDQLGQKLGPDYVVLNLGQRGAATGEEIDEMRKYPYAPDILILSYFVNDIEGVAKPLKLKQPPQPQLSPLLTPLAQNSYAFNFLYWRLFRLAQRGQPDLKWAWQIGLYNNLEAWALHRQELLSIYDMTQTAHIPLIVVVFPSMTETEQSQAAVARILQLYADVDVPTLDVTDLIQDIPVTERIATSVDPHPSELVHQRVAEALYQQMTKLGLTAIKK